MTRTENNELTTGPGAPFQPGELVDVTIRSARIVNTYLSSTLVDLGVENEVEIVHRPGITFERVAPPEWPPQPADVWRDRNGNAWAALGGFEDGVEMRPVHDGRSYWSIPDEVLADVGPMRLEYRPGWTRQPAVDEPVELGERAQRIAALREFADLLESRPDLPAPYSIRTQAEPADVEQLRALVGDFGIAIDRDDETAASATLIVGGELMYCLYLPKAKPEPVATQPVAPDGPTAALPIVNAVESVDEPVAEEDDRCQASQPGEFAPGEHKCELYGTHPESDHLCLCGLRWPNAAAGYVDPATGRIGFVVVDDNPVPAPREAAE